jgi:two-component system, NarL family, invasion response regulator UvrY
MSNVKVKIALADDHTLFRKGMISLIQMVNNSHEILFEADNGIDVQHKIDPLSLPDIMLIDVNMPVMDGYATVEWLKLHHPSVKVLVVSMIQDEESIMRMIKLGVKGYLSKDVEPEELKNAIAAITSKGFYYTDYITGKLVHSLQQEEDYAQKDALIPLNAKEKEFIKMACSEFTYAEIAQRMNLSPKTIDGYRLSVFEKLGVKSRVGLAIYALRNGMVR